MPYIHDSEVDASNKGNLEDTVPSLLDSLSTSSPQKSGPALLAPFAPVIFVEAKDSSLTADLETSKYEPINVPTVGEPLVKLESEDQSNGNATHQDPVRAKDALPVSDDRMDSKAITPLDTYRLSQDWISPQASRMICGLENLGNSCFLNSTLQILMHTIPLVNILLSHHPRDTCPLLSAEGGFCFACSLKRLLLTMWSSKTSRPKEPTEIFDNIRKIAPSFRRGRQEDAHEFLRFSIDALQLGAQKGVKDVPDKIAETSWVYRLFGGKFRSRVHCTECNHNSDTFDTLLDLSVDVGRCDTLDDALKKFAAVEKLEGKNKYNCEKCNKPVNARKQITVHSAPQALCIQLKRFTPWGRKLTHQVEYPRKLDLDSVMSLGETSLPYQLYGIICHAGGTPNSGHYYAFVQNPGKGWSRMNDEESLPIDSPPLNHKTAYMLFYMREQASIESTIAKVTTMQNKSLGTPLSGQKRKREEGSALDEDLGERVQNYPGPSFVTKKPRLEPSSTPRVIPNVTGTEEKSKFSFARPKPSGLVTQPIIRPNVNTPLSPNKNLGLDYGSSDAEDGEAASSPPPLVQASQTDDATSPPSSPLPVSRQTSPEPPSHKPWQKKDSTKSSPRTPRDSPPSSSDLRKRTPWEPNGDTASNGLATKRASEDSLPPWATTPSKGGSRKTAHKKYGKHRSIVRHGNPYGSLGLPSGGSRPSSGVQMGPRKNKRPGI